MREKITIKVLRVQRFPSKTLESYKDLEVLSVTDLNDKRFELSRFRKDKEITCKPDHFYMGSIKPTNDPKKYPNDIFEDALPITGFNGIERLADLSETTDPQMERQAKFDAWGDLHTVAPLVAGLTGKSNECIDDIIERFVGMAKDIGKKAREKLTQEYLKEMLDKEKDDG